MHILRMVTQGSSKVLRRLQQLAVIHLSKEMLLLSPGLQERVYMNVCIFACTCMCVCARASLFICSHVRAFFVFIFLPVLSVCGCVYMCIFLCICMCMRSCAHICACLRFCFRLMSVRVCMWCAGVFTCIKKRKFITHGIPTFRCICVAYIPLFYGYNL